MAEQPEFGDGDTLYWRGREYIPSQEAAEHLGYKHSTLLKLLANDKIPGAKKWGRFWYVRKDQLEKSPRPEWKQLAPTTREAVEEMLLEDIPPKAVASRLGVPLPTVYSIRRKLFRRLAEENRMFRENYNAVAPKVYARGDAEVVDSLFLFRALIQGAKREDMNEDYLPNLVRTDAYIDILRNTIYVPPKAIEELAEKVPRRSGLEGREERHGEIHGSI